MTPIFLILRRDGAERGCVFASLDEGARDFVIDALERHEGVPPAWSPYTADSIEVEDFSIVAGLYNPTERNTA